MFVKIILFLGDIIASFRSVIDELALLFENFTSFDFYNILRPIIYYFRAEKNMSLFIVLLIILILLAWFFTRNDKSK